MEKEEKKTASSPLSLADFPCVVYLQESIGL